MATNNSNLALLIDGDNVSHKIIAGLMAEVANYGTASVRRIYSDWTDASRKGWKECLLDYSITPIQQFAYTTGKNATDGAMIIDAMDLLYTGRFAGFCIVSSDSDFTRLASRIREQCLMVHGFGERKTAPAFIAACNKFIYFDVLSGEFQQSVVATQQPCEPGTTSATVSSPGRQITRLYESATIAQPVSIPERQMTRPLDRKALNGLGMAVYSALGQGEGDDGWVNLAKVGVTLSQIAPDVHPRNYGYEKMREFVEASGILEVKRKNIGEGRPPIALVRLKHRWTA